MRSSNQKVAEWLLSNGFDHIWFKPHTKRNDRVRSQKGTYLATDLWNLFDGVCVKDQVYFLQMKTNSWAKEKPLTDFAKKYNAKIISFNVTNKMVSCKGRYLVFVRYYPMESQ